MTPIDPNAIYLPDEVADMLRCSRTNVYGLMRSGQIASVRVGAGKHGLRVMGSDIIEFIEDRKSGGPEPRSNFKHLAKWLN